MIIGLLRDLNTKLIEMIQQSYGIDMGNVGKLKAAFQSTKAASADSVTADNIERITVRFLPSTRLKGEVALDSGNVTLTKYESEE